MKENMKDKMKHATGAEAEKMKEELDAAEAALSAAHALALKTCSVVMAAAMQQWTWGVAREAVNVWRGKAWVPVEGKLLAPRNEDRVPPHMRCKRCEHLEITVKKGRYSHGLHVAQIVAFEWAQAQRKSVVASWRRGFLIWMKQENLTCKVLMLTWGDY